MITIPCCPTGGIDFDDLLLFDDGTNIFILFNDLGEVLTGEF
jgi:hypothetical protein